MPDKCLDCPAPSADMDGFIVSGPGGAPRSDSEGVSGSEGPFAKEAPQTGPVAIKGTLGADGNPGVLPDAPQVGWAYVVEEAGEYGGVSATEGDMVYCMSLNPVKWGVLQADSDDSGRDLVSVSASFRCDPSPVLSLTSTAASGEEVVQEVDMSCLSTDWKLTAAGSTTGRTLPERFADVINVKDFGAVGDGTTDDTAAIRAALNYAHTLGGACVFFPSGVYRHPQSATGFNIYGSTKLLGCGHSSVILFEYVPNDNKGHMFNSDGADNIIIDSLCFRGNLDDYMSSTEGAVAVVIKNAKNVLFTNCYFEKLRFFALACRDCDNLSLTKCSFRDILRDGAHFGNVRSATITGNYFYNVADNPVTVYYMYDSEKNIVPENAVIANNFFEACQGINVWGVKKSIITNNLFVRTIRIPIWLSGRSADSAIYDTPSLSCIISNNMFFDTMRGRGNYQCIYISNNYAVDSAFGNTAPVQNYTDTTTVIPLHDVKIIGNTFGNILPVGVNYSSYGYGLLLDRVTVENGEIVDIAGYQDPVMTADSYNSTPIALTGAVHELVIEGNTFFGAKASGIPAIQINIPDNITKGSYVNCKIKNNIFKDYPVFGVIAIWTGTPAHSFEICDNLFDLDPFFRHPNHNADNTWADGNGGPVPLYFDPGSLDNLAGEISNNTFKNCAGIVSIDNLRRCHFHDNKVYFQPQDGISSVENAQSNKGVRNIRLELQNKYYIIDGDPTSSTYSHILACPANGYRAMPSAGFFVKHDFVPCYGAAATVSDGQTLHLLGWRRLTTGSNHVSGVDWAPEYSVRDTAVATSSSAGFMSAADKAKLDASGAIFTFKGSVADAASLPSSGNDAGDAYAVTTAGTVSVWDGTAWVDFGPWDGIPAATNAQIDALFAA